MSNERETKFWLGNLLEIGHLADQEVNLRVILKYILRKQILVMWIGLNYLRIGFSDRLFYINIVAHSDSNI
jgi:hypothetical protein